MLFAHDQGLAVIKSATPTLQKLDPTGQSDIYSMHIVKAMKQHFLSRSYGKIAYFNAVLKGYLIGKSLHIWVQENLEDLMQKMNNWKEKVESMMKEGMATRGKKMRQDFISCDRFTSDLKTYFIEVPFKHLLSVSVLLKLVSP
jgi:hypothetical protein